MASTKGTALIQCVKALKAFPGATASLPPHLHHYLNERILVSSWYPEEDYLALITAMTKVIPSGVATTGRASGSWPRSTI